MKQSGTHRHFGAPVWDGIWSGSKYSDHASRRKKAQFKLHSFRSLGAAIPPTDRLLDLGCGAGYFARALSLHTRATILAVDISEIAIHRARLENPDPRIEYRQADARSPFAEASPVDGVFLNSVLEHVPDSRVVLDNAYRVLRPGGRLYLCTSNALSLYYLEHLSLRLLCRWVLGYQRHYTPRTLEAVLRSHGFTPEALVTMPCIREGTVLGMLDRICALFPCCGRYVFAVAQKGPGSR